MSIVRNFNLYLNAGNGSAPYINVNQYDQGEQWVFTLYKEDGTKYTPSTGAIVGIKADNRGIINTGTVDADGRVVINETQQMTAAAGIAIFELLIDGETHGTANFLVNVEQRPGDNADLSDSDLSMLQEAIDAAELINEILGEGGDPSEIITENVNNWLDNHPEATTTVEDGAITEPKINNSLWDKLLVSEEASGNPASFDDGADDVPVSSLKVSLEPVQLGSGDPSPTNVRPISGHSSVTVEQTGKNLWKFNNSYTLNAAGSWLTVDASRSFPLKAGTYTWSFNALQAIDTIQMYFRTANDVSKTVSFYVGTSTGTGRKSYTFTLDEDVAILRSAYCNGAMSIEDIQIELGSESTDYEPYTGNTYPYSLGQNVYGGSVDLATGVLTVTHKYVALGDYNWIKFGVQFYTIGINDFEHQTTGTTQYATYYLSDCYSSNNGATDVIVLYYNTSYSGYRCFIHDASAEEMTAAEYKTRLQTIGAHLCYKLATPTTIQLTPTQVKTLLGYNNISSTGTVDVIYHADTKLYVDKMTAVDNAIIAPTEETFTATRNYTVNDLVIVNDTLYKVIANIASGSTITPNSNVTQTTLSALIKALS